VVNNKWYTKLDSYCISKGSFTGSADQDLYPQGSTSSPYAPTSIKTINSNYSNVNFKDGVVNGAMPSTDNINVNLLKDISKAAVDVGVVVSITTAVSGHHSNPPSRHTKGNAIDVAIIDGIPVNPNAINKAKINEFVMALQSLGYIKNSENGNLKSVLTFGYPGHDDHVHISNKS
jgi:hypothetical protein